jgi:hypothetical protein
MTRNSNKMTGRVKLQGSISHVRESHVRAQRLFTHVKSKRRACFRVSQIAKTVPTSFKKFFVFLRQIFSSCVC